MSRVGVCFVLLYILVRKFTFPNSVIFPNSIIFVHILAFNVYKIYLKILLPLT